MLAVVALAFLFCFVLFCFEYYTEMQPLRLPNTSGLPLRESLLLSPPHPKPLDPG
jgi:hypothetical protein